MNKIDFQNGFIAGFSSKGKVIQKQVKANGEIDSVTSPVYALPISENLSSNCAAKTGLYYPVTLPQEYEVQAVYYSLENNSDLTQTEVSEYTEGLYYKYTSDEEYSLVADFSGEDSLNFSYVTDTSQILIDYPCYVANLPKEISWTGNSVYLVVIDEGTDDELIEYMYTMLLESELPYVGGRTFFNEPFMILPLEEGGAVFYAFNDSFLGQHTVKIMERKKDSYPRYAIRINDTVDWLGVDILNKISEGKYTVKFINSEETILGERIIELTEQIPGHWSGEAMDGFYSIYQRIKNEEKIIFKLIDSEGVEIISSSITKKSQISAYQYTDENPETTIPLEKITIDCYCWGNEYISPARI